MLLSSRVIKQVDSDMENWPVQARISLVRPETANQESEQPQRVEDSRKEAELILTNSRLEADKLLAEVNAKISIMEREACEKGFKRGEQEAWQEQRKALEDFHQSTRQVLQEVNEIRQKIFKDTELEILALSIDIAEKLVCRQLELKPETIVDIARAACIQAKECEMVIIYAAPDQVDTLKSRQEEFTAQLYRSKRLEFIADPTIKSGGCRIETEQGYIDATVETMLKQLNTIIMEKS